MCSFTLTDVSDQLLFACLSSFAWNLYETRNIWWFLIIVKNANNPKKSKKPMIPIAIIQDNMEFISPLPGILERSGDFYVTRIYYFIEDALKGLQETPVDIIILDIKSPSNEYIECIREIKNKDTFTKWLVYTVHDNDEMIFNALRAGANGYILKDAQPEHLKNALYELARGGAPVSPRIMNTVLGYFHHLPRKENNHSELSQREKQILHFTSRGLMYKEIALQLGIQRETVKKHLSRIYEKLCVQNKIEAMNKFYGL